MRNVLCWLCGVLCVLFFIGADVSAKERHVEISVSSCPQGSFCAVETTAVRERHVSTTKPSRRDKRHPVSQPIVSIQTPRHVSITRHRERG